MMGAPRELKTVADFAQDAFEQTKTEIYRDEAAYRTFADSYDFGAVVQMGARLIGGKVGELIEHTEG